VPNTTRTHRPAVPPERQPGPAPSAPRRLEWLPGAGHWCGRQGLLCL